MSASTMPSRSAGLLAGLLAALILAGCGGKNWFSYTGWETKPDNRYFLKEGGPHAVVWKSPELDLHYRYRLEGNRLQVEGEVVRRNRIKHFPNLTAWVNIHLLDENGIILDTHRLWSARGSTTYTGIRWYFENSWKLPEGNEAVGFSFTGVAGDDGPEWRFWQTP